MGSQLLYSIKRMFYFIVVLFIYPISVNSQAIFSAGDKVIYGDTGKCDVYLSGGEIFIESKVVGDAIIAGGKIFIKESISEDLMVGGGQITVDAEIGDDVRIFGGQIRINKPVNGDVIIFGGDVEINKDATINGNLILFSGQASVYSNITGSVKVQGGELKLDGNVGGMLNVKCEELNINGIISGTSVLSAEKLFIGEKATFDDDVIYWTSTGEIDFGSSATGVTLTFDESLSEAEIANYKDKKNKKYGGFVFGILRILAMALVLLALTLFNPFLSKASNQIKTDFISSLGWGTLIMLILPLLSLFLLITIIGIPLGLIGFASTAIIILISKALASLLIAHYLNKQYQKNWSGKMIFMVALGIYILFRLLSFVPILGILISVILILVAIGSVVIQLRSTKEKSVY